MLDKFNLLGQIFGPDFEVKLGVALKPDRFVGTGPFTHEEALGRNLQRRGEAGACRISLVF
jgi:hypothetical protein